MLARHLLPLVFLVGVSPALAQSGANVLLVANGNSADSVRIAEHYARARAVPQEQLLRIKVDANAEEVDRGTFEREIQAPIAEWLTHNFAQDRILYLVLTKGVPLRIQGTAGRNGTVASVDSELTLLYRRMTGATVLVAGSVPNPYYLADNGLPVAKAFTHANHDIYLVTRLDGFTVNDALALVDRATRPAREGKVVLDERAGLSEPGGDQWLDAAASWLSAHGFGERVLHDATTRAVAGEKDVLGYYSWGSNDPAISARHFGFGFLPGAIGGMFVSTDARTFREPPPEWKITTWGDRANFFAGSPQSLIGDLVRDGITGASGYVAEPYLDATVRPQILFPAYFSGFNLAESFYLATPSLSWQNIVLGDPLCRPFPGKRLEPFDIDKGLDAATELPAFFAARSLQASASTSTRSDALKLMLRAQARAARHDSAGRQKALEEATALDPRLYAAHLLLAAAYEEQEAWAKAVERYRQVLASQPRNVVALNNLAYTLAVRQHQAPEALAYAERAYALSRTPTIADTLAWVQHLLGRDKEAAALLTDAVRREPENADIHLHAAVVFAVLGMVDAARKELAAAVRLNPSSEKSKEFLEVQQRIGK